MQIQCPRCAQDIPTTAVNMERFIAKCDNCNSMFDISDLAADVPGQIRGKVPLPKGLVIAEDARDFVITRRWFRPFFILLVFPASFLLDFRFPSIVICLMTCRRRSNLYPSSNWP